MSILFSPVRLKGVTLRNRIALSPMCQYSSTDGYAADWHMVHYGSRAAGGAGLIIQEATAVAPEGRITPGDLGLYSEDHIEGLRRITAFIEKQGSVPGIQLAHAGRKAGCARPWEGGKQISLNEGGWQTVAPSALTFNPEDARPLALDKEGLEKVVADFGTAARRSIAAGYKVIEIHSAHGYLLHEFLSPLSNHREDSFGGNLENRARLLLGVVREIRSVIPDSTPLFVRISATDWVEGGWDTVEAITLASMLKNEGVDLVDSSSGGMVPYAKIPLAPGYQVPFADMIRREAGIMTGAVGLITGARQAEEILQKDQADLIILGRELLRDPHFPIRAARELGDDITWPPQYLRAKQ